MKKFILIGIALIAMIATPVLATSYQPTDQLQTHLIVQQPQILFSAITPDSQAWDFTGTVIGTQTQSEIIQMQITDGWRAPFWVPSMTISCRNNSAKTDITFSTFKIQKLTLESFIFERTAHNYNIINYSYGLRN
jgi:hypothetical protein